jgi:hypothetical protein
MPTFCASLLVSKSAPLLRSSVILGFAAVITACGGGGGGGGGGNTPTAATVPLATAYNKLITDGLQAQAKISGSVEDISLGGDATIVFSPAVAATFEGQAGMSATLNISGTLIIQGGPTIPLSPLIYTTYYDSNYKELGSVFDGGSVGSAYAVVTSSAPLPTEAHAGDSGDLYNSTSYSGPSKMAVVGRTSTSYRVEADTANSLIFTISVAFFDNGNNKTETDDYRYRVDSAGKITLLSIKTISDDANVAFTVP